MTSEYLQTFANLYTKIILTICYSNWIEVTDSGAFLFPFTFCRPASSFSGGNTTNGTSGSNEKGKKYYDDVYFDSDEEGEEEEQQNQKEGDKPLTGKQSDIKSPTNLKIKICPCHLYFD